MPLDRREVLGGLGVLAISPFLPGPLCAAFKGAALTPREGLHFDDAPLAHLLAELAEGDTVTWFEECDGFRLIVSQHIGELQALPDRTEIEDALLDRYRSLMRISPF